MKQAKTTKQTRARTPRAPRDMNSVTQRSETFISVETIVAPTIGSTGKKVDMTSLLLSDNSPNLYAQYLEMKINSIQVQITVSKASVASVQFRRVYAVWLKGEDSTPPAANNYARLYDKIGFPLAGQRKFSTRYSALDDCGEWHQIATNPKPTIGYLMITGLEGDEFNVHYTVNVSYRKPGAVARSVVTAV